MSDITTTPDTNKINLSELQDIYKKAVIDDKKNKNEKLNLYLNKNKTNLDKYIPLYLTKFALQKHTGARLHWHFTTTSFTCSLTTIDKNKRINIFTIDDNDIGDTNLQQLYDLCKDYIHENIIPFTSKSLSEWKWG